MVLTHKELLYNHAVGLELLDQESHFIVDRQKPQGKIRFGRSLDRAVFYGSDLTSGLLDYPVAGYGITRVDTNDPVRYLINHASSTIKTFVRIIH